jgi:signal transduction histidine kinase
MDTVEQILLVGNSASETTLLSGFLEFGARNFGVKAVTRLADGIQALKSAPIDVALVDLVLEDSAGLDTLLRLREAAPEVVIVVLTSLDDEAQAIEALKNGAQDYLLKANLNQHLLFRAIRYAIERKRAETERRLLEQRLLEGQTLEAIGTLARGVAHNFNNILTAILGRSELILEREDATDKNDVMAIKRSAQRAASLTRQLLTFSRKQNHARHSMNLDNTIADMKILLEATIANEIALEINLAAPMAHINGDRQQIGQLLMNLVINARAATMPEGGRCTIETTAGSEHVQLSVRDNGCGIPAETLGHIFQPFFSTKGMALATGLGLSVVYGIVQQHGGTIEVASKPGEGTMFSIRFPHATE